MGDDNAGFPEPSKIVRVLSHPKVDAFFSRVDGSAEIVLMFWR